MSVLLEQNLPVVREQGLKTNKNVVIGGSANLDLSGSTGTLKFPTGATTGIVQGTVTGSPATVTLTAAQSGEIIYFDRAAGIIYTLPAPVPGLNFTFIVTTSVTSNNHKIITDTGTTLLIGQIGNTVAAGTQTGFIANGTTHISVLMNGTTTGGLIGSWINVICTSSTQWIVDGVTLGSGTVATPFSTS